MEIYLSGMVTFCKEHMDVSAIHDYACPIVEYTYNWWVHHNNDNSEISPLYKSESRGSQGNVMWYTQSFELGNEIAYISWDIDELYKAFIHTAKNIPFGQLRELTYQYRKKNQNEMLRVFSEINSPIGHKYKPILVIYFKPIRYHIIIDGRHRYTEYAKFSPKADVPVCIIDDEKTIQFIRFKRELLSYIAMHNMEVLINFYNSGMNDLSEINRMLDPRQFGF